MVHTNPLSDVCYWRCRVLLRGRGAAFLRMACRGAPDLHAAVERYLRADAEPFALLDDLPPARGPAPLMSSCWCCPFRGDCQWRELRDELPEDWARAVALEEKLRERDEGLFLHRSGVPLAEAVLGDGETGEARLPCQSGFCFV